MPLTSRYIDDIIILNIAFIQKIYTIPTNLHTYIFTIYLVTPNLPEFDLFARIFFPELSFARNYAKWEFWQNTKKKSRENGNSGKIESGKYEFWPNLIPEKKLRKRVMPYMICVYENFFITYINLLCICTSEYCNIWKLYKY